MLTQSNLLRITSTILIGTIMGCQQKSLDVINSAATDKLQISVLAGKLYSSGHKDGIADSARFWGISSMTIDEGGNLYVTDNTNELIRKITSQGAVTTLAGRVPNANTPYNGKQDGPGNTATFLRPIGIAADVTGKLYVCDYYGQIRLITSEGQVSTLGGAPFSNEVRFRNGPIRTAVFFQPFDIAFDSSGNLYIADCGNSCIRKMTLDGQVSTFAGKPQVFGHRDGPKDSATFNGPWQLAFDSKDNLFVSELNNNVIRKITPNGDVTTFAGGGEDGETGGYQDGVGKAALFGDRISDIAFDTQGNLYVSDPANGLIRKITPNGTVNSAIGNHSPYTSIDPHVGGSINALIFDKIGNLYVADDYVIYKIKLN